MVCFLRDDEMSITVITNSMRIASLTYYHFWTELGTAILNK